MSLTQAVFYGIVQGVTEFLPVSSSAHLVLLPWLFGWPDPGLGFDVALHWGTLAGVILYFRRDVTQMTLNFIASFRGLKTPEHHLPWQIIVATIPGALLGLIFEEKAETIFRTPALIGLTLSGAALLLFFSDRWNNNQRTLEHLTWKDALLIGVSQGIAIVPGVSRSGITIIMGLLLGLERATAVRFSFLLSMPIILGAGLLKIDYMIANINNPIFWTGLLISASAGLAAIHFLITYVRTKNFTPFVIYRLALAALIFILLATGVRAEEKHPYGVSPELDSSIRTGLYELYNLNFEKSLAIFDSIKEHDAEHPMVAFGVASSHWWRISSYVLESSTEDSKPFLEAIDRCIDSATLKIKQGDPTGEGYLVLGGAYGLSGRWEATNRSYLSAYRKGKKAYKYLNKALEINPNLKDAYMGKGIFDYFVATLPAMVRMLAFIGMGGDPQVGIHELEEAATNGIYAKTPAKLFLSEIYTREEDNPQKAMNILLDLRREYPVSPLMHMMHIIALYNAGDLDTLKTESEKYQEKIKENIYPPSCVIQGFFARGISYFKVRAWKEAIEQFEEARRIEDPKDPWRTWSVLYLGHSYDALGERERAKEYYTDVLNQLRRWSSHDEARKYLRTPFQGTDDELKKLKL